VSEPGKSQGGGNLKYILGGFLLLAGAAVVAFMLRPSAAPAPKTATREPARAPERVNPMAQPDLILDEPKDAGQVAEVVPDASDKPKPQVREARSEWDCDGDLSISALQAVIDNNRAQVRSCYERRLKVNNVLQGDLKLKLKVSSTGQIAAAQVGGSIKDNEVFSCVRSQALRWSFPPPSGGNCAVVQVPFQFSPKN